MSDRMISVVFVNNDNGGFNQTVEVPEGTTARDLFAQQMSDASASDYIIRVNRESVSSSHVMADGARMTVTPTKVEGA